MSKPQNTQKQQVLNSFIEAKMFLEFPLAVISKQAEPGAHSMTFEDEITDQSSGERVVRRITITSGKYGLPIAGDMDVLLALMILTSERNKFREAKLEFSLTQVCRILRWPDTGRRIQLLKNALARWVGVTVYFENARRVDGRWISLKGFHLLETIELTNTREDWDPEVDQHLRWNRKVLDAMQAGFISLDWDFYLSLKSATAKRLYRFLSKRFEQGAHWPPYELEHFSVNKVGMRNGQAVSEYKRNMWVGMSELMERGFLHKEPRTEVFIGRGKHTKVRFKRSRKTHSPSKESTRPRKVASSATSRTLADQNLPAWAVALQERGVAADDFVNSSKHKGYNFELAIEYWDYLKETDSPLASKNPQGFLAKFIRNEWVPPDSYITKAEREEEARRKTKVKRRRELEEQRRLEKEADIEARHQEQDDRVRAYLDSLDEDERERVEALGVEHANDFMKGLIRGKGKESTYHWMVIRNYVLDEVLGEKEV